MKFIGRRKERAVLEAAYAGEASAFLPVYGRRRVGKSELLVRFLAGKAGVYVVGKCAPAAAQIREFLEAAARALAEPLLAEARPEGWKAALELVAGRWPKDRRRLLVLDEFPWMAEASPELPSVLQELWDRSWSKAGRAMLILCGSYLGFMEREVLGRESPLFGRRTGQILLRPFDHREAAEFHPRLSRPDQARVYGVCGGVPMYLAAFDERRSVAQNLTALLLDETAALAREPEFLLREELRDLATYHALLVALARGAAAPVDLAAATGVDARLLAYYLGILGELGYVQRRRPLADPRPSARAVRYALDDPLLRFWFRFVFPHQSLLRALGPEAGFAELVKPELEPYFGRCFERLCREALPGLYAREGVRTAFEVGEYWDADVQIDVVGLRQDGWTDVGECTWGDPGSWTALAATLEQKIRRYPNGRNATIGRRVFARNSPRGAPPEGIRLHTLDRLYDGAD